MTVQLPPKPGQAHSCWLAAVGKIFLKQQFLTGSVEEWVLLASSINDFHAHGSSHPVSFREVHLGHLTTNQDEKRYMLCGEFLPAQEAGKAKWASFATIKTSDYEQWIGASSMPFCGDSSVIWDLKDDWSSLLRSWLDTLR